MKGLVRIAAAAALAGGTLLVTPAAVQAGSVDPSAKLVTSQECTHTSLSATGGGITHAQLRSCSTLYWANYSINESGATISFQMRDAATDGYCAEADIYVTYLGTVSGPYTRTECTGNWTTYSFTADGSAYIDDMTVFLSYSGHGEVRTDDFNPFPVG